MVFCEARFFMQKWGKRKAPAHVPRQIFFIAIFTPRML